MKITPSRSEGINHQRRSVLLLFLPTDHSAHCFLKAVRKLHLV